MEDDLFKSIFTISSTHISAFRMINQTFADIINKDVVNSLVDNQFSFDYELNLVKSVKEKFNYLTNLIIDKQKIQVPLDFTEDLKEDKDISSSLTEPRRKVNHVKRKGIKKYLKNKYLNKTKKFSDVYGFKTRSDCLRKRFKTQIHSFVLNKLNAAIKEENKYFFKLPSIFSTNLNHDFNKKLINMTLKELFSYDATSKQYDKLRVEHNKSLMSKPSANENFIKLSEMKWYDLYREYIVSQEFSNYMAVLKTRFGYEMSQQFYFTVKNYTDFYLKSSDTNLVS